MSNDSERNMGVSHGDPSVDAPLQEILLTDSVTYVGRSGKSSLRLLNPTISRSHASIERKNEGFVLQDLDSRYGTFVNGNRIGTKELCEGDLIRFGTSTSYRFSGGSLVHESHCGGYSLSLQHVSIIKNGKRLVADAGFDIPANSFVGILGPSGSGKSTLLNVLASYHIPVAGSVFFDGARPVHENLADYRAGLGNVPQQDIVFTGLSARENLSYSGRLRGLPTEGFAAEVDRVLAQVGLTQHADKPFERLSGGQQKRVSVALELLKRPMLLLLDEPTSGLDPAAESGLMEQLKVIASQGTTVVCTTHHMENVALFDMLVVLGVKDGLGRIAYVGEPDGFLQTFACRSYADAFERLRDGNFDAPDLKDDPVLGNMAFDDGINATINQISELVSKPIEEGIFRQAAIVAERGFLRIWRDKALVVAMVAQPVVLGSLIALTQFNSGLAKNLHFFLCVVSIWLGLNNSARDLVRERRNYVRERLAGLAPDAYLLSKLGLFASIGLVQMLILMITVDIILRVSNSVDIFWKEYYGIGPLMILFWLFVSYLCGLGLGLLASTWARSEESAVAVLPLLIMPQILISSLATGEQKEIFKPFIVGVMERADVNWVGRFVDWMSLTCYSRPTSIILVWQNQSKYPFAQLGDCCHLLALLVLTWSVLYFAFRIVERKWPKLLGLS
jgi:ABC-type multidrug transport system ATPase subunit